MSYENRFDSLLESPHLIEKRQRVAKMAENLPFSYQELYQLSLRYQHLEGEWGKWTSAMLGAAERAYITGTAL